MNVSEFAERAFDKYKKKYTRSIFLFVFLNISSITLISSLILLNIFAIKWNTDPNYRWTKIWFIVLATLNGFIGVLISMVAFFKIKLRMNKIQASLISIKSIKNQYYKSTGPFEIAEDKDERFINIILDIIKDI